MELRRITHSHVARTFISLVTSACIGGTGSGLIGVNTNDGGSANVGQILPVVQVAASDSLGNIDTTFTGVITVALASNATGAGLRGNTAVRATGGVATFTNLSIDAAGTYTLRATASGAGSVTSSAFVITTVTGP